jgi:hypothetical protein
MYSIEKLEADVLKRLLDHGELFVQLRQVWLAALDLKFSSSIGA